MSNETDDIVYDDYYTSKPSPEPSPFPSPFPSSSPTQKYDWDPYYFFSDSINYNEVYAHKLCKVYDSGDIFTVLVQVMLLVGALLSLGLKRHFERPRRKFRTWLLDVGKQGLAACYAHVCNMVCIVFHIYTARFLLDC